MSLQISPLLFWALISAGCSEEKLPPPPASDHTGDSEAPAGDDTAPGESTPPDTAPGPQDSELPDTSDTGPPPEPMNLLILTLDTLRWDMSEQLPFLTRRMSEAGISTPNMWGAANWTQPSMPSIMSGLYGPHLTSAMYLQTDAELPPEIQTLSELLSGRWASHLDCCNGVVTDAGGAAGFDSFKICTGIGRKNVTTDDIHDQFLRAEEWIAAQTGPWLAWIHAMDPHDPFNNPAPECAEEVQKLSGGCPYDILDELGIEGMNYVYFDTVEGLEEINACAAAVEAAHRCDVLQMDKSIEAAWARMEAAGMLDNTVVAVVADHGESYFEDHGFGNERAWAHHRLMNSQVSRGVMWFWTPETEGKPVTIEQVASQVDFAPTLLTLIGEEELALNMDGLSVLALPDDRVVTQFACDSDHQLHAAVNSEHHLILKWEETGEESWNLYHIEDDPHEATPLDLEHPPELVEAIRAQTKETLFELGFCQ